jgi:outer membrane protein
MKVSTNSVFKKERCLSSALWAFLALFLGASDHPALAAKPLKAEQIRVYESADEGQRVHFLIERAKMGQGELVENLLKHFPLQGPHATNRKLFIEGLILEVRGDLSGAAKKYRAALARDPSLTLVRVQLVGCLDKLGQDDSAKHHLQLLEAEAPNKEVASSIKSFMDRIDAKRPLTFTGFISLAPSTNINSGSSHTQVYAPGYGTDKVFDIFKSDQKRSGVGAAGGLGAAYSKRIGNQLEAVVAADVSGSIYADREFDSASFSQSLEMRYHLNEGYIGLGGVADQSINPNSPDLMHDSVRYHSYGPRVSTLYFLGEHNMLHASAVYEWRDYADSSFLDGTAFLSEASLNHGINQTLNLTLSGGFDKINSNQDNLSYNTYFAGFGLYKELPMGINLNANTQIRLSTFDQMNPAFLVTRQDQRYIGSLAFTKRDLNIFGFAPAISYTYTKNVSNITLYDYDSHAVDLRLTKDF